MKWEYMTVMFETGFWVAGLKDGSAFNDELNKLGEQGWELVSVFQAHGSLYVTAVLKRQTR